jgi:hypothetical protein
MVLSLLFGTRKHELYFSSNVFPNLQVAVFLGVDEQKHVAATGIVAPTRDAGHDAIASGLVAPVVVEALVEVGVVLALWYGC